MELTQLKYFLKVAETQHVTKSADFLHVAQPALTQAIHRLEEELEGPLFTRKGRNIILTPYGEYFYKNLLPLYERLENLPEKLKTMANLENSTVHLNVLAASTLVTEAIIEYERIDNSLCIELKQNQEADFYDINVSTRLFYQCDDDDADSTFVCTEKIYIAVPNIEKYAGLKKIRLSELKNENFIALSGSRQLRLICDKYCESSGFKPHIIFESDSPQAVKNMIAANMGIGFWPEFSWEKVNSDRVLLLEIEEPEFSRDIIISYRQNKTDNEKVFAFFKYLEGYFKKASCGEL